MAERTVTPEDEARYWPKVEVRGAAECWPWSASCTRAGYGRFVLSVFQTTAQRVAWALAHDREIPPKHIEICHTCDNPPCCNPAHLFAGTMADNMDDKVAKGRQARGATHGRTTKPERTPRGSRHGHAKLTEGRVRAIRVMAAAINPPTHDELAAAHGVSRSLIGQIVRRTIWKHVN